MGLIKDGKVYRTEYEQIVHLTEKHEEQLTINENLSNELARVSVAANQGGYNLVRFSFERSGTFYRLADTTIKLPLPSSEGDYFEFSTGKATDIPAYGFFGGVDGEGNTIVSISFKGDFTENYETLMATNITKGTRKDAVAVTMSTFGGTALTDYDANENKRQLFSVINDVVYGGRTQYASFDLNRDGRYNFVYIGSISNGKDGASVYSATNETFDAIHSIMKSHDTVIICSDTPAIPSLPDAVLGDVYEYVDYENMTKVGNIRGPKGEQGIKGDTGATGATGPQGATGATGATGPKGEKGEPGQSLRIHDGIKATPEELPIFSTTLVADAYVVLNTSGAVATYDLYYHAIDGTDWSILPNWGGVPGPAGPQGPTGATGATGATGPAGVASPGDITALVEGSEYIDVNINSTGNKVRVGLNTSNVTDTVEAGSSKLLTSGGAKTALDAKLNASKDAISTVGGLVKPTATPSATELVGISSAKEQVRVNIGNGLSFDDNTKTLSASGGGDKKYVHYLHYGDAGDNGYAAYFTIITNTSTPFTVSSLYLYLFNNGFVYNANGYTKAISCSGSNPKTGGGGIGYNMFICSVSGKSVPYIFFRINDTIYNKAMVNVDSYLTSVVIEI